MGATDPSGDLTLELLTERFLGKASSHPDFGSWKGRVIALDRTVSCPSCARPLDAARGTGPKATFVLLCASCRDFFTPAEVGTDDSELVSAVIEMATDRSYPAGGVPVVQGLEERLAALAAGFHPREELLAAWGMSSAMPDDFVPQVFDLWASIIDRNGGRYGSHDLAQLHAAKRLLLGTPSDVGVPPLGSAVKQRFDILWAALDIEGEILGRWGMTSLMPEEVRAKVFSMWDAYLNTGRGMGGGRSIDRLRDDGRRLHGLREEPKE